jgi:phosphate transport system substrate-binding protein
VLTAKSTSNARRGGILAGVALVALALSGCGGNGDGANPSSTAGKDGKYAGLSGQLKASGASFPNAYYQEVLIAFKEVAPNVTVTYNAVGSGTGKKEFAQGLTDFAGTDSAVKDSDGLAAGSFYYVPTVAAPITVSYNLSGVDKLRLSADTLAKIFQRDIKTWNDPALAADNPGVTMPNKPITVVHRSDGSGTTSNFTKYLDAASDAWRLGSGDTVNWPTDTQGGERNAGVAQLIKQGDGTIGYVDLSDAKASGLTFAAIKNKDGNYVEPTLEAATAALAGAKVKDDLTYDSLNAAGAQSYPITAPTYILVKAAYDDPTKAALVKGFLTYLLTDGQALAKEVDFAQLPDSLRQKAIAQIEKVKG